MDDAFAPLDAGDMPVSSPDRASAPRAEWTPILPAPRPLPATIRHPRHGTPAQVWRYADAAGALLLAVARFDLPSGKEVLPYTCGATGWRWKAPPAPRPLYGLDRLAARPDAPVLVVEGERTADAAGALFPECVAVTWPGGALATAKVDWSPLAGRHVVVWPDADAPGRKAAEAVATALRELGAASLAVVDVPADWPAGWDLADALPEGVTARDLEVRLASALYPGAPEEPADAGPAATLEAEVARLAALSPVRFAAERRSAAARWRVTVPDLKAAVTDHRRRLARERQEAERERQRGQPGATLWPPGFTMTAEGLVYASDDDKPPVLICGPFSVAGEHRTSGGGEWGLTLRWVDRDGRPHTWPMPRRLLMSRFGDLESELVAQGLHVATSVEARALLRAALSEVETSGRICGVLRAGWHAPAGGPAGYVTPAGEVIGTTAEPLVLLNPAEDAARRCARAGTAEGWAAEVATLAVGNPVATFCVAFGLAGVLLEPGAEDGVGAHLFGPSKRGKTVALRLAASIWGPADKGGALKDWRATANGLEAAAAESSDGLMAVDEMGQADPHTVVEAAYGLLNGAGKGRLRADATARQRRSWRVAVLSNGESDMPTVAQKAGQRVPPGAETRMPSIPLPATLWPQLHGRADFGTLCGDMVEAMRRQHGTAGPAFVAWIAARRVADPDHLPRLLAQLRDGFLARYVPAGADQQPREVARRLALVAAAGELGVEAGVLPWRDGEATRAAGAMFRAWLNQRGGAGSGEDAAHLAAVRLFVVQHGASRMQVLAINVATNQLEEVNDPTRPVVNRCGWRRRTPDGDTVYMFPRETWKAQVCDGLDPTAVARTLFRAGHLVVGEAGNLARKERIPGMATPRLYVVRSSILDDAEALEAAA